MAEVVNLRRARKQRLRLQREGEAQERRAAFGMSAKQRQSGAAEARLQERRLDAHRRDPAADESA